MPNLRVFDRITRQYQRLGYLKRLIKRVSSSPTSNLDNLGNDLVDTVMMKVNVPLTEEYVNYIKTRLFDNAYKGLKDHVNSWLTEGGTPPMIQMEIQDLYLSDPTLPSSVGKLVNEDWRFYPPLGVNLGLIRSGSFSATTRAYTLLHFISEKELISFKKFSQEINPLKIDLKQALLFLYSFIEHDGEVFIPLIVEINQEFSSTFNDREVGDLIPDVYMQIISRYRKSLLSIDIRERLDVLEKSANSIAMQSAKKRYSGGSSREHASRPRLEPYVDIGLFSKPNPMRYEYKFSEFGSRWVETFTGKENSTEIEEFLHNSFFGIAVNSLKLNVEKLSNTNKIIANLRKAAEIISSSSGYAPIEELSLLAAIESLVNDHKYFEIWTAREALLGYQKNNPYEVRFTVDRMGKLAHVKFMNKLPF